MCFNGSRVCPISGKVSSRCDYDREVIAQLGQALEVMGMMYQALAGLRRDVLPKNRKWFNFMAEGPADEIRKLQKEIDAYTGMDQVVFADEDTRESDTPRPMPGGLRSIPDFLFRSHQFGKQLVRAAHSIVGNIAEGKSGAELVFSALQTRMSQKVESDLKDWLASVEATIRPRLTYGPVIVQGSLAC